MPGNLKKHNEEVSRCAEFGSRQICQFHPKLMQCKIPSVSSLQFAEGLEDLVFLSLANYEQVSGGTGQTQMG